MNIIRKTLDMVFEIIFEIPYKQNKTGDDASTKAFNTGFNECLTLIRKEISKIKDG